MNVGELIERLSTIPTDYLVTFPLGEPDYTLCHEEIRRVKVVKASKGVCEGEYNPDESSTVKIVVLS